MVRRMPENSGYDRSWSGSHAQVRDHSNVFDACNGNIDINDEISVEDDGHNGDHQIDGDSLLNAVVQLKSAFRRGR